jgi:hypothetical protein
MASGTFVAAIFCAFCGWLLFLFCSYVGWLSLSNPKTSEYKSLSKLEQHLLSEQNL